MEIGGSWAASARTTSESRLGLQRLATKLDLTLNRADKAMAVMQSEFQATLRLGFHAFVFSFVFNAVLMANV